MEREVRRVFWVLDNGSSHRGERSAQRLRKRWQVEERLLGFEKHYAAAARPFEWKFTRRYLERLLARLGAQETLRKAA